MHINEMQVFQSSEFGELGVLEIEGKPWFPATACAKILGYANPRDAIGRHCVEDGVVKHDVIDNLGRTQSTKFITEGNLYRLITHSKLPAAERFEKWVFDEVLPTIRRTGGYGQVDVTSIIMQTATAVCAEMVKQLAPLFERMIQAAAAPGYEVSGTQVTTTEAWRASYHPGPRKKVVSRPPAASGQLRIETFPAEVRQAVDEMMEQMVAEQALNFSEIARYCNRVGCMISSPSVRRYYDKYFNQ